MSLRIPAGAKSWFPVSEDSGFPIQNLPLAYALLQDRVAVLTRIGDFHLDLTSLYPHVIDVAALSYEGWLNPDIGELAELRQRLYEILKEGSSVDRTAVEGAIVSVPMQLLPPVHPGAFVDFYSGIHHASNVGRMFRPEQPPLLPNYRQVPIGYNGRASTVFPSGTSIRRPFGQQKRGEDVVFEPTRELDFELEMGFYTGTSSDGQRIPADAFAEHALGMVIVNDWSARDVQRWEYQPLGPFLAKSFATSVSPYLVSFDALEPFRIAGMAQEPPPLSYLRASQPWHYDIELEVSLKTATMSKPQVVCRSNTKHLYWSMAQQLAHQASNGTLIEPGDLYATGTISGPEDGQFGSLLELSWRGEKPLTMEETGETRTFLEDGDTVSIRAWAQGDGYRIGFGEVAGTIEPAAID